MMSCVFASLTARLPDETKSRPFCPSIDECFFLSTSPEPSELIMAQKEATVYIVDVGASMGECHGGRSESDLDWVMKYVWDKITTTVCLELIGSDVQYDTDLPMRSRRAA
jgi:hypothetical protein